MEHLLLVNPWVGMFIWTIIYLGDYWMTIASARKYRSNPHLEFEGSFELTPQFEKDVDALKTVSRRHLLMLILTNFLLLVFWWLFLLLNFLEGFLFVLGMLLLMEVGVHIRHFRTYHLLTLIERGTGMQGRVTYRRWLLYSTSAFEFLTLSILFLLIAILSGSLFFLGGAASCLSLAFNHHRKYRSLYRQALSGSPQEA